MKMDRWNELMRLVNKEMKLIESATRKGSDLEYRLLELHSEKLKLIHAKNNKNFMEKANGTGKDKEKFFVETRAYYNFTKNYGHNFLKRFPNTVHKPWVYFTLGLNSRDFGHDKIAERYLLDAIHLVKDPHTALKHHAQTALADHYYNEKRYDDAITYYERVIKKTEDEWLTKHLFNLSWCYLKTRNFEKAIATIKESYFTSKNKIYVDMRDQVLDNIGSFHVYASKPLDGLEFYLENEKDPVPYLIPMAMKAMDKGHKKETEEILDTAQKIVTKTKQEKYQEQLYQTYLDFYRHYNEFEDHEKIAAKLVAYYQRAEDPKNKDLKLPVETKDDAIEKMRSLAGYIQVKLSKDMKQDRSDYREKELKLVLNYFNHLIVLDKTRKGEYLYFRAETYYSLRRYKDAAPSYRDSIIEARITKDEKRARKALNSLLALTGMEVLDKEENRQYLIFGYTEHIAFWPKDEKSEQIYPKLFEIYRELHDDEKAADLLALYNKNYPQHLKSQQEMMTKILDQFIEKKNTVKLVHWINRFKKGFLSFSQDTITKTEIVLGNILFIQYQDLAKKGDKLAAAKGFEEIYVNKLYTDKVKYQSAFFASLAYLELGESVKSYHWLDLAHARMNEEQMVERRDEELKITERMYRLQDFKTAYKMSENHLKHFCAKKDANLNRFFEIGVMTALVEDKPQDAEELIHTYSKCTNKPELADQSHSQIYQYLEKQTDFYALRDFMREHMVEPYLTQWRITTQKWYWETTDKPTKNQIFTEFKRLNHDETNKWVAEIMLLEDARKAKNELSHFVFWNKPAFDGDAYNKSLENYLLKVQQFKDKYSALTQASQTDVAIISTKLFAQLYLNVGGKIATMNPQGLDKEIVVDFQKAMKQVAAPFLKSGSQYEANLAKALKDKEALTMSSRAVASVEDVENPVNSFFTGLTMDKE
jgi:hypothetical protein